MSWKVNLQLERSGDVRLAVANRNVPKILGSILALLSDANVNIVDMLNKSRDEIAYNLIDLNGNVDDALLAKIADLDGVVNVRVIR